ncbi:hypothetical protein [Miltoncostaea oceani]|uniref:hypothetical protein n=1 Tax=Miltoncostaea oceani TaxID=2843216 RepID=UPI001C3E2576|nr:hypothetical protein [Miltoncostaea oceani]
MTLFRKAVLATVIGIASGFILGGIALGLTVFARAVPGMDWSSFLFGLAIAPSLAVLVGIAQVVREVWDYRSVFIRRPFCHEPMGLGEICWQVKGHRGEHSVYGNRRERKAHEG